MDIHPIRQRRKDARPTEIIEAAMEIFIKKGFAGAKLDDIARSAGVAKGTLYLYFETKEDLFRAVVQQAAAVNFESVEAAVKSSRESLRDKIPKLLTFAALEINKSHMPALARLVIGESQGFPDLARIWHDNVIAKFLALFTGLIEEAQASGEVRAGDPSAYAFSIVGPLVLALLFHNVLNVSSSSVPELTALAVQHSETVLHGLLVNCA